MGKKHYGHSHHSHHHHHGHDWLWGHQNLSDDLMAGTWANDVLKGSDKSEIIFGLRGNDDIGGGDGNDWVIGGRGNDHVDGGPGSDKVFAGKGDDVATYVAAENANANAFGHGDFYDGGKGHDILRLILTQEEMANKDILADIEAYQSFLDNDAGGCGSHGKVFEFTTLDLAVRNFEEVVIEESDPPPASANNAPVGVDDTYTISEDTVLNVNAQDGVLNNASGKDTDADGDPLSAILVDGPQHGTLMLQPDGSFVYTPDADYNSNYGPDGFTYRASDGTDESAITNVEINVTPVNDPPMLKEPLNLPPAHVGQSYKVDILDLYLPGPTDEQDEGQTLELVDAWGAMNGVAGPVGDQISYFPFNVPSDGVETLHYTIADSAGGVVSTDLDIDVIL